MAPVLPEHGDLMVASQQQRCQCETASPSEQGFPNGFRCSLGSMKQQFVQMHTKVGKTPDILLPIPFEMVFGSQDVGATRIASHVGFDGLVQNKPVRLSETREKTGCSVALKTAETTDEDERCSCLSSRCVSGVVTQSTQSAWLSTIGTTLRRDDSLVALVFTVFLD